jgi:hypothetical protein
MSLIVFSDLIFTSSWKRSRPAPFGSKFLPSYVQAATQTWDRHCSLRTPRFIKMRCTTYILKAKLVFKIMVHFIPCFLNFHSPQIRPVYFHTFHSFCPSSKLPAHYAYASTPYLSFISASLVNFLLSISCFILSFPGHISALYTVFLPSLSTKFSSLIFFFLSSFRPLYFFPFQLDIS